MRAAVRDIQVRFCCAPVIDRRDLRKRWPRGAGGHGTCNAFAVQWLEREFIMAANALIQTRIDPDVKARAAAVLEALGLTVSDAVRILLTRTAREGALPFDLTADPQAYDAWFRAKVLQALEDTRPDVRHEDVEAEFAARRTASGHKPDAREAGLDALCVGGSPGDLRLHRNRGRSRRGDGG
jgi:DNA-damage-inducible protein J